MIDYKTLQEYRRNDIPNRKLIHKLMEKDPHCHWCGVEVLIYEEIRHRDLKRGESYPPDMATVDHLYHAFEPEIRYKVYKNGENKVLACYSCNQKRGKEEVMNKLEYHKQRTELGKKRPKGVSKAIYFTSIDK